MRRFLPLAALALLLAAPFARAQGTVSGWTVQSGYHGPDWTGLTWSTTDTSYSSNTTTSAGKHYFGSIYLIGQSTVGGSYGEANWSVSIYEPSTFEWQWTPPNIPGTGTPFPAETFYGLGGDSVNGGVHPSSSAAGLSTSGSFSDGFGDAPVTFNTVPGAFPTGIVGNPGYGIVTGSGSPASVTLSPTLNIALSGTPTGDSANFAGGFSEGVKPIYLSTPNRFGRPDLGFGSSANQFVYGISTPDGYLYVPGTTAIAGGDQVGAQWLASSGQMDMKVENSTIPGTFAHQWAVSTGSVSVNTPNNSYPAYQANNWVFKGLPADTSGFGNHEVNLYLQGTKAQTAKIQTFFNAMATNWPASDGSTANWYHYYNQIYSSPGTYQSNSSASYTQSYFNAAGLRWSSIYITDQASGSWGMRIFGLNATVSPYVICLGTITTNGIHNYIETCAHELGHANAWLSSTSADGFIEQMNTSDGDMLVNSFEDTHHFNSHSPDTTGGYSGVAPDVGDNECVADIQALQPLLDNLSTWQNDWSNIGLQHGPLYFSQASGPPDFYWQFTPSTSGVYITPSGTSDTHGYYHIKSLSDIQQIYPGTVILTNLQQLDPQQ